MTAISERISPENKNSMGKNLPILQKIDSPQVNCNEISYEEVYH